MPEVDDLTREPTRPDEPTGDAALRAALVALAPVAAARPWFRAHLSHPDLPDVVLSLRGGPDGPWIDVVDVAAAGVAAAGTAAPAVGEIRPAPEREPEPAPLPRRVPRSEHAAEAEPPAAPDPFFASLSAIVAAEATPSAADTAPMPDLFADRGPALEAKVEPEPDAAPDPEPGAGSHAGLLPPSQVRLVPMSPVEESFAGVARAGDAPFGTSGTDPFGWGPDAQPAAHTPAAAGEADAVHAAVPDEERDLVARLAEVLSGDDWDGPSTGVPGR